MTQININPGYNDELMEKCSALRDYMIYVDKVRTYQKTKTLEAAINLAVDECIKEDVLSDFFKRNRAEVVSMSLFEYDKELHEKTIKEIAHEEGFNEGKEIGIQQGKDIGIQQGKLAGLVEAYYKCGKSIEDIAELTGQSPEYVKEILETNETIPVK